MNVFVRFTFAHVMCFCVGGLNEFRVLSLVMIFVFSSQVA